MSTYQTNKRASFDYEIIKSFEAGLVLFGYEVKSIRSKKAKLEGSHILIRGEEAFWVGSSVSPYQPVNTPKEYDPERARTLLLSKKEIREIERATEENGLTCIPIKLYGKDGKVKLEIAIAKGKKKVDKRESIKKRDTKRDLDRIIKSQ